jgi:adenylyltransferase/sulfurtransferase
MTKMGYNAQLKLKKSKACLVGLGGLGSPASMQLAAMGVGYLRIVDRDFVDWTNLHRQHLYGYDDVGYAKVEAAAKRLKKINPNIIIEPLPFSINPTNAENIIKDMDIVIDGLDSMAARYSINRACVKMDIPYIFGAAINTTGNLSTIIPKKTVCLECFYGNLDDAKLPKCGVLGIHPSVVNIIASLEVSEAIRILIGKQARLANKLLHFDLDEIEFNEINLAKVNNCPVCGINPSGSVYPLKHKFVEEICGRKGKKVFVIIPEEKLNLNLYTLNKKMVKRGFTIKVAGKIGLTSSIKTIEISVLNSGIMIIKGFKEKEDALTLFKELISF